MTTAGRAETATHDDAKRAQAREELHARIATFLRRQFSRGEHREYRKCTHIDLVYTPQNRQPDRTDQIRSWDHEKDSGLFRDLSLIEGDLSSIETLSSEILRIAAEHAETFGAGYQRYEVRTTEALGGRAKVAFRIRVEDDDIEEDATEDDLPGPLDLSLRCNGVNVEIHMTAAKCRNTGSFLDHLVQRFLPQMVNQMAPSAARAPEAEHPPKPIPSIVDFARERLAADELSLDDMASVSKILHDEHDRRVRRAERARSPALTITDLVEDYLDHHPLEDRDLVDLIDVVTAAERRARGEPGEATS